MVAAYAWVQHVHGGICMSAACAWWRHMHECGTCIGAADACVRHSHVGALLASTKARQLRFARCLALYNAHVHVATLACSHQGKAPSLRSMPRLISPAYKAGMG